MFISRARRSGGESVGDDDGGPGRGGETEVERAPRKSQCLYSAAITPPSGPNHGEFSIHGVGRGGARLERTWMRVNPRVASPSGLPPAAAPPVSGGKGGGRRRRERPRGAREREKRERGARTREREERELRINGSSN